MSTSKKNPLHIPSPFQAEEPGMTPEQKEQEYVHNVYQVIAPHFSATRYKPWPVVEEFLMNMPAGSVGADVGCGNGKYIGVNPSLFMIGSDRSSNLISICSERGHEAMVCDGLALPYRPQFFDFAISIAVIHHFITPERRINAIEEILRVVRVGAKVLIFVWALEQSGKRDFDKNVQDVFVPWAMPKKAEPKQSRDRTQSRAQGVRRNERSNVHQQPSTSLSSQSSSAAVTTAMTSLNEASSIDEPLDQLKMKSDQADKDQDQKVLTTHNLTFEEFASTRENAIQQTNVQNEQTQPSAKESEAAPVYNRYYHLFQKGELEELVVRTNKASIVQSGYDRDNWWCILEKTTS
ncbi:tRNA methyltransferase, has a role in tRNA modification [Lobosporangium transversale]|uniref:S-adenosyl-L-methionine-dependent methyltransferase n=1 Tax=Lobosporangium transversale TaxID=64571 RepID=A0A1Y2GX68_9FUNG|nr:S-adenosyl-L-methionine-dependent methyltransferase [Lobosporangium transversale]KAF9898380.1 tRNA methyltransferase, has a role in tRNA modification [Lobosporangium transversale]ORZ26879.1 S-adenosyl-L-methionine-dependent methyltransferase [Lobosporangium transversale]|eukprot:XP_021884626.1 S-adenosyl-L-methionine-dependent methyltransferase [Lobosporangium transversale]